MEQGGRSHELCYKAGVKDPCSLSLFALKTPEGALFKWILIKTGPDFFQIWCPPLRTMEPEENVFEFDSSVKKGKWSTLTTAWCGIQLEVTL